MDPKGVLESWLAPITDPLKDFRSQVQEISTIHQNSVKTFQSQVNDLTDSSSADAMTGAGADSMTLAAENYTSTELTVSELEGSISSIANASGLCEQVVADLLEAMGDAGFAAADVGTLAEVTAEVDASAVLQGGFDPFDDVIAGVLTSVTVETVVAGLIIFVTIIAGIIWVWRTTMDGLAGSFQYSALPEKPQPISPPRTTIPTINNLTDDEKGRLQNIKKVLVGIPFDSREIIDLMKEGYTDEEIIAIVKARRMLAKDNNKDDKFTYNDNYLKALAKKGLDSTYLADAVVAGTSAGITLNLSKEEIINMIDILNGRIYEDEKPFNAKEKSVAYYLSSQGYTIIAQIESEVAGQKRADSLVIAPNGETYELEIKTITTPNLPATAKSVINAIKSATKGRGAQADHILIDGRETGLTKAEADSGIRQKLNDLDKSGVKSVEVLGNGFDKTYIIKNLLGQ